MSSPDVPVQWRVRPYRPGDESALVELFEEVFHRSISKDHWRWKLKQRPSPAENVWLAVDEDDRPVFHIGGIPCRFQLPAGSCPGMVMVDSMTAPQVRRRGLLTAVWQQMRAKWRDAGISMLIGLPNEQWGSRRAALGWQPLFPLKWLVRPLRPEALLARRLKLSLPSHLSVVGKLWNGLWDRRDRASPWVSVRELDAAGAEIDSVWRKCQPLISASIVRDSAWVNWRYFAAPHFEYRVLLAECRDQAAGYAVYRVHEAAGRKLGFIAEMFTAPHDFESRGALLAEILRRLKVEGAEAAVSLAVPHTEPFRALRRCDLR